MLLSNVLLFSLSALMLLGTSCGYRVTQDQLKQLIDSKLPQGSDKETVIAFLDSRKIEYSGYLHNPEKESDYQENKLDQEKYNIRHYIVSIIRDVKNERFSLTSHSIQIYFYFDDQGRLVKYSIREILTSM